MNGPFKSTSGIAYPSDMMALKQVFDRVCKDYDIKSGSRDADDVARAVMSLFSAGVHEEAELLAGLKDFLRRTMGIGGQTFVRQRKDQRMPV